MSQHTPTEDVERRGGCGEHEGLDREGLLQGPGRLEERRRPRDQEGVPHPGPKHHPDTNRQRPAEAKFKEVSEAYDVLSDAEKRKEYDEARTLFGSGGFRFPGGFGGQRRGRRQRDLDRPARRCASRAGRRTGRPRVAAAVGSATCSAASSTAVAAERVRPPSRRRRRERGDDVVRRGADGVTVSLRLTTSERVHGLRRDGRGARDLTRGCARPARARAGHCATRAGSRSPSRAASAAAAGWSSTPVPHRARAPGGPGPPAPSGAHPGRASRTVRGSGSRARAPPARTVGPAGDLFIVVHVRADPVFGRAGDNLTVTRAGDLRRGRARRRRPGPAAPWRAPVTLQVPAGHGERSHVPRAGPGRHPARRHEGRPARHRRGRRAAQPVDEAREALSSVRRGAARARPARGPDGRAHSPREVS